MRLKFFNDNDLLILAFWVLITFLLLSTIGCVTAKKCNAKFPPTIETITNNTTEIIRRDSLIQGASVTNTIYKDSIVLMPVNKWHYIKDTNGIASLRWYKDAYGNIQMQCDANSRLVEMVRKEMKTKDSINSKTIVEKKVVPFWALLVIAVLCLLLLKKYINL
jgi:hypothetical protein